MKQAVFFIGAVLLFIFILVGKENFGTAMLVIAGIIVVGIILSISNQNQVDKTRFNKAVAEADKRAEALKQQAEVIRQIFMEPFPPAVDDQYPRYVFMDFETTDLPVSYSMPTAEFIDVYPFIVQAAVLVFNDKHELVDSFNSIIKAPETARFAPKAVAIHGITKYKSTSEGVDIINLFAFFKKHISGHAVLIAHNIKFDNFMLNLECKRNRISLPKLKTYCTMMETIDLCKIEKEHGRSGYKWPNLKELVYHSYTYGRKVDLDLDFHDAMTDIKLCAMCFFELKLYEKIEEQEV